MALSCLSIKMIVDVLQTICNYVGMPCQLKLCELDKYAYHNLYIYEIKEKKYDYHFKPQILLSENYGSRITQNALFQRKYEKIRMLDISFNIHVTDINHLADMQVLICPYSELKHSGMKNLLKIKRLVANENIHELEHLNDILEDLSGCANINQDQFYKLKNITKLDCSENSNICDISHLKNKLIYLKCSNCPSITQNEINKLNILEILDCSYNRSITNVNRFSDTLKELYCTTSGITNKGMNLLNKLEIFNNKNAVICDNFGDPKYGMIIEDESKKIYNIGGGKYASIQISNGKQCVVRYGRQMRPLNNILTQYPSILDMQEACFGIIFNLDNVAGTIKNINCRYINQKYIAKYNNLEELCIHSHDITDLKHLSNTLKILSSNNSFTFMSVKHLAKLEVFGGYVSDIDVCQMTKSVKELRFSDISQQNLNLFENIECLYITKNRTIKNLSNVSGKLKILYSDDSNITESELFNLSNVEILDIRNCSRIHNVDNMKKLRNLIFSNSKIEIHGMKNLIWTFSESKN